MFTEILIPSIIATAASFILGMLWYGPLFGQQWSALSKIKKKKPSTMQIVSMMAHTFITAVVIALFFVGGTLTFTESLLNVALLWLAFNAAPAYSAVVWNKMPKGLYLINTGFNLVSFLLMTAVLTLF